MKGVMLKINPLVTIVDITHTISPQNIMEAAITIGMSFDSFPSKTIHVVVVDPDVGSKRRPILVITDRYYFIGPDNGVFSQIYNIKHEMLTVIHLTAEHYFMPNKSATFHGRDIFAPVAAWLSRGIEFLKFGDHVTDYVAIPFSSPVMLANNIIEGEVIYLDRFGNTITNIKYHMIDELRSSNPQGELKVLVRGKEIPVRNHYSEAEDKGLYSLINSFGFLELFVYRGSASSDFSIAIGEKVSVIVK